MARQEGRRPYPGPALLEVATSAEESCLLCFPQRAASSAAAVLLQYSYWMQRNTYGRRIVSAYFVKTNIVTRIMGKSRRRTKDLLRRHVDNVQSTSANYNLRRMMWHSSPEHAKHRRGPSRVHPLPWTRTVRERVFAHIWRVRYGTAHIWMIIDIATNIPPDLGCPIVSSSCQVRTLVPLLVSYD